MLRTSAARPARLIRRRRRSASFWRAFEAKRASRRCVASRASPRACITAGLKKVKTENKPVAKKQNAPKSENIKPDTPKVKKPVMQEIKKEAKVKKEIPTRASNDPRDKT